MPQPSAIVAPEEVGHRALFDDRGNRNMSSSHARSKHIRLSDYVSRPFCMGSLAVLRSRYDGVPAAEVEALVDTITMSSVSFRQGGGEELCT